MKNNFFLLSLFLLIISFGTVAQVVNITGNIQDSLSLLSSQIWKQKTEKGRLKVSEAFFRKFQTAIESPNYVNNPFDSIKGITRAVSEDAKLILFTWNVPLENGENKYYGFIQVKGESLLAIPLRSVDTNLNNFETSQIPPLNWYGALYYKIIDIKLGDHTAYTLLGWDGYTPSSNRKIIDILSFDKSGQALFGMPVFKTDKGNKYRVVKEYAENSNMVLRYDYQSILVQKGKKTKKENAWLIVMDRLVPMDPTMKGITKYYVPSGDTYDGFVFKNNYWVLVEDIEVSNRSILKK
jgi:hypothetical protein